MLKTILSAIVALTLTIVLAIVNTFWRLRETHGDEINPEQR